MKHFDRRIQFLARLAKKTAELPFMTRDFILMLSGRDYFHLPENLGNYFRDGRSYYNDMSGKAHWEGPMEDGVPTLFVPSTSTRIHFPSMILQYGIGSLDKYFESGNRDFLKNTDNVYRWLSNNIRQDGSFDNKFNLLDKDSKYYSQSSGMTQGLAISFLVRLKLNRPIEVNGTQLDNLIEKAYQNLIMPVEIGGGTLYLDNGSAYICEYCREDNYVVLNGWVFGIFGLIDYVSHSVDASAKELLSQQLMTLEAELEKHIVKPTNWSYYDNQARICSPIYHSLHIHLIDALYRLTGRLELCRFRDVLVSGYTPFNRVFFTLVKIRDKLLDTYSYATV